MNPSSVRLLSVDRSNYEAVCDLPLPPEQHSHARQGQGLGSRALRAAIEEIAADPAVSEIEIC